MDRAYQEFLEEVLWRAKKEGAQYADCRLYPKTETEDIKVENGQITTLNSSFSQGFGVRVLKDGSWGFYASPIVRRNKIREVVERAIRSAEANALIQKEKIVLAPLSENWPKHKVVTYRSEYEKDPSKISVEQKLMLLASSDEAMRQTSKRVFWRIAEFSSQRTQKLFASTDGVFLDQTILETGASVQAYAKNNQGNDTQRRSYPNSHLYYAQGGYELIQRLNLAQNAGRIAQEAGQLLAAPRAPSGKRGAILLPEMLNLHGHETAHGFEADRVLGTEWTLAGGSFLSALLPRIGNFQFGSPHVNLTADSLSENGVGTFAYDDEGTSAQRIPLVKNGVWVGLLTSRETLPQLNEKTGREYFVHPSGAVRAAGYGSWPVIRMVLHSINVGPSPRRARSVAFWTVSTTSTTLFPSHTAPGMP